MKCSIGQYVRASGYRMFYEVVDVCEEDRMLAIKIFPDIERRPKDLVVNIRLKELIDKSFKESKRVSVGDRLALISFNDIEVVKNEPVFWNL